MHERARVHARTDAATRSQRHKDPRRQLPLSDTRPCVAAERETPPTVDEAVLPGGKVLERAGLRAGCRHVGQVSEDRRRHDDDDAMRRFDAAL